jgi:riboflavin-specific deaminase-like protein
VRVQELRTQVDGILVGVGTVVTDDPSLRVHWELLGRPPGTEPIRVVVDGSGRTPETAKVLDGSAPTIVGTTDGCRRRFPDHVRTIAAGRSQVDLRLFFERLADAGVSRLLVEGGSRILGAVLREGLYDHLTVYYAPYVIGDGSAPPIATGPSAASFDGAGALELTSVERKGEGYVASYRPRRLAVGPAEP